MARPILVVKNIADAPKRYTSVLNKDGDKAARAEFGIPFPLQHILAAKPSAKGKIFGALQDGDRFDGSKLVRVLGKTDELTGAELATAVEAAVID